MNGSTFPQLNDAAWLREQYEGKKLDAIEIAAIVGCERSSVIRAMKRHGIQTRRYGNRKTKFPQLLDRDWLASEMATKTLKQIAAELGTSVGAVGYFASKHGLADSRGRGAAISAGLAKKYPEGRRGAAASNWRGGRRYNADGYILLYKPEHPRANRGGAVFEHIVVAEEQLGRLLEPGEIVHHLNHVKDDNRPENLVVKTRGQHVREHFDAGRDVVALRAEIARLRALLERHGINPEE